MSRRKNKVKAVEITPEVVWNRKTLAYVEIRGRGRVGITKAILEKDWRKFIRTGLAYVYDNLPELKAHDMVLRKRTGKVQYFKIEPTSQESVIARLNAELALAKSKSKTPRKSATPKKTADK